MRASVTQIAILLAGFIFLGACMEHNVGGKKSGDVFSDISLKELANAGCKGDVQSINKLVKSGTNVNGAGLDGMTPLIWALTCENEAGLTALLKNGADPNKRIKYGMTAVLMAATYKNSEFLKTLIKHGGNLNDAYDNQTSVLEEAFTTGMHRNRWDNYYILLDAGAEFKAPNKFGDTFADFVIAMGHDCKVLELIERGYDYRFVELLHSAKSRIVGKEFASYQCKKDLIKFLETKVTPEEYETHIIMLKKKHGYGRKKPED